MVDNEPLYALQKAHKMKMYRAVEAKKVHQDMVKYFDNIANYNISKIKKYDVIIRQNKLFNHDIFSKFWELN